MIATSKRTTESSKLRKTFSRNEEINIVEGFVGNTPLYPLRKIWQSSSVEIFAKLEWQQLGGSVKARPAFNIICQALRSGQLLGGKTLLDASSGNTGIAYASLGARLGVPVTLVLPENASADRIRIISSLGAEIVYSSPLESTEGARKLAAEIAASDPEKYFYADQYSNENNWLAHYRGTANEIWQQTHGEITHFVAGLGTTGTFTGTTKRLKELNPELQAVELQPETSLHGLEGWKHLETADVPQIYQNELADQRIELASEEVYSLLPSVARREGLLISPSAAANLLGAIKVAEQLDSGKIVTIFADDASRYAHLESFYQQEK